MQKILIGILVTAAGVVLGMLLVPKLAQLTSKK